MKVVVPAKRVVDYNVKARVIKMSVISSTESPSKKWFRLKEKGVVTDLIAVFASSESNLMSLD